MTEYIMHLIQDDGRHEVFAPPVDQRPMDREEALNYIINNRHDQETHGDFWKGMYAADSWVGQHLDRIEFWGHGEQGRLFEVIKPKRSTNA